MEDLWSLIPDEVRTALDSEIQECILLACTKLSLHNQEICTLAEDIREIEPFALSRDRQFLVLRVEDTVQVWA